MSAREPWQEQALCPTVDPEIFFVDKGGSTREAKQVCYACPVRVECLTHALDRQERYGIWGALSAHERYLVSSGRADPDQFNRCRNGHDRTLEGIDYKGQCRRCVSDRRAREKARAQTRRDTEAKRGRCPVCRRPVTPTAEGMIAAHLDGANNFCPMQGPYEITIRSVA